GEDDLVLVLVSGGGSALWCLPVQGLALEDKRRITSGLLHAGAHIRELNTVRRALSGIKGGRLAAAAMPARVETLIVSDVAGDDPAVIASGPTVPWRGTPADANEVLARYGIELPPGVRPQAPPAISARNVSHRIVASASDALAAAAEAAKAAGCEVRVLGRALEGEARAAAALHAAAAREARGCAQPVVILSGGELTVKVRD